MGSPVCDTICIKLDHPIHSSSTRVGMNTHGAFRNRIGEATSDARRIGVRGLAISVVASRCSKFTGGALLARLISQIQMPSKCHSLYTQCFRTTLRDEIARNRLLSPPSLSPTPHPRPRCTGPIHSVLSSASRCSPSRPSSPSSRTSAGLFTYKYGTSISISTIGSVQSAIRRKLSPPAHPVSWVSTININLAQFVISLDFSGDWSQYPYLPPSSNDSRSCCPALNALANHGTSQQLTVRYYPCSITPVLDIFPHDGKNIPFVEMTRMLSTSYNLSPTLCLKVYTVYSSPLVFVA